MAGAAVAVAALAVAAAAVTAGPEAHLGAAPLYGRWAPLLTWRVAVPVAVGAVLVAAAPAVARRLPWRALLPAVVVVTAVWAVALAAVDGGGALTDPLESRFEYLPLARQVDDVPAFVDSFVERLPAYPTHVRGHPPGMVALLALLDRLHLGGAGWVAALVIAGGGVGAASALVLVRQLVGEAAARAAAPFVVALPAAVWVASTADALFAGVALAGTAVVAVGASRRSVLLPVAGGVLLGAAAHLSYGVVVLAPVVVAAAWRRWGAIAAAAAGALGVVAAFLLLGFSWWEGLAATRIQYDAGLASSRPYGWFVWANLAAVALAAGPAVVAGLATARGRWWRLLGPVAASLLVADLSGLAKGEVERIWLFLVLAISVAAGALPARRAWLAANLTSALVLAVLLRTPW